MPVETGIIQEHELCCRRRLHAYSLAYFAEQLCYTCSLHTTRCRFATGINLTLLEPRTMNWRMSRMKVGTSMSLVHDGESTKRALNISLKQWHIVGARIGARANAKRCQRLTPHALKWTSTNLPILAPRSWSSNTCTSGLIVCWWLLHLPGSRRIILLHPFNLISKRLDYVSTLCSTRSNIASVSEASGPWCQRIIGPV